MALRLTGRLGSAEHGLAAGLKLAVSEPAAQPVGPAGWLHGRTGRRAVWD